MILKKEGNNNDNIHNNIENNVNENLNREDIRNNIRNVINGRNQRNIRRGFNIFLLHGLSPIELRAMRILFHLSAQQQSLIRGEDLDWSEEAMFQREERWLINQLNNPLFNSNNDNDNDSERDNERDNEREMINVNNNYISLNINESDAIRRRYIVNLLNFDFEPNYLFLMGFCAGILFNIFGIILLLCRFRKKFKIGLIFGIIISIFFYWMTVFSMK